MLRSMTTRVRARAIDAASGILARLGERLAAGRQRPALLQWFTPAGLKGPATLLAAALTAACAGAAAQPAAAPPAPTVTVAEAVARELTEWDEQTGRLEPVHTVEIRPRVSGFISDVHFREGAIVGKGDLLFTIDARPFQAEVDRLRAELARAEATVRRADSELARAERLAQEQAISSEEHDRRASFAQESRAQKSAVEAALRAAELNLEFTRVTAPTTGRIGRAIVTAGNLVSSGPGDPTLLATVVSLDPIYATFETDEGTFLKYAQARGGIAPSGSPAVRMALATDEGFPREGRLIFLDNQIDPSTGTIRARALFSNRDLSLTPGLFVRVRVPLAADARGVVVQERAIGTDLDRRYVLVVGRDETVEYRVVSLGPLVDGLRLVRSGLEAGERVVVNGMQHVQPGMKVRTEVEPMDAAATQAAERDRV